MSLPITFEAKSKSVLLKLDLDHDEKKESWDIFPLINPPMV